MFYYIFYEWLNKYILGDSVFRIFKYITFRSAYAVLTALAISFFIGPYIIRKLVDKKMEHSTNAEKLDFHKGKVGTPTMGGIIIMMSVTVSSLLWTQITNRFVIVLLICTVWLCFIGFLDDYLKLKRKASKELAEKGLGGFWKLSGQLVFAVGLATYLYQFPVVSDTSLSTCLDVPFFSSPPIDLGFLYFFFIVFVIIGATNAVNLTDGLDGLAIGGIIFASLAFVGFCYAATNIRIAEYLKITFIPGGSEMVVFLAALVGASLGFLWYNSHPAQVFMGDTGSLMLGGIMGTVAVLIRKELLLVIIGGLFVIETLSVMVQVASYKLSKKRVFAMAPLHHHFEKKGWAESKIVVRFWIIAAIFALISLSTLKLR